MKIGHLGGIASRGKDMQPTLLQNNDQRGAKTAIAAHSDEDSLS